MLAIMWGNLSTIIPLLAFEGILKKTTPHFESSCQAFKMSC